MSEKPTVEEIIDQLQEVFENRACEDGWTEIGPRDLRTLIDGIREMQEEIKQDREVVQFAVGVMELEHGNPWAIYERLKAHLAKEPAQG